jgi:phage terminase large subunit-like protein
VFANLDDVDASLTKRASAHSVNLEHPLVTLYADFVTTLDKLATARAALAEVEQGGEQVEALLKQGSGLVGAAKKGFGAASKVIDTAAKPVAHILVGAKGAKDLAPVLAGGTKLTALGVGALAANAGLQSVTDRPGTQRVLRVAKSITPGTPEYQERRYRHMSGM